MTYARNCIVMHRKRPEREYACSLKELCQSRLEYNKGELLETETCTDPFDQLRLWFSDAKNCPHIIEPNACILATVFDNRPSTRTVLIKEIDEGGLVFFTNYESRKARDMRQNPIVSITFYWAPLERQIHIQGSVEILHPDESDAYFDTRPKASKIGAIISPQSDKIKSRDVLMSAFMECQDSLGEKSAQRPKYWGGYRIKPSAMEFWQGRKDRLHDRLLYEKSQDSADSAWQISRLAP